MFISEWINGISIKNQYEIRWHITQFNCRCAPSFKFERFVVWRRWTCHYQLISWASWCTAVFTVWHFGTSLIISLMLVTSLHGIQRLAQTVLGVYLKRTCSRVTSESSALGVLNVYTLYKSTHSLTRLRSANRHQLIVPRCRLNTYGRRAFSIAGLTVWNSLPR